MLTVKWRKGNMGEKSFLRTKRLINERRTRRTAYLSLVPAAVLWYVVFELPISKFWVKMAVATIVLATVAIASSFGNLKSLLRVRLRHVVIGIVSAAFLYGVFLLGKLVLIAIIPSAEESIGAVYSTGSGVPSSLVAFLLLFITSPAEEIYWRGFLQRTLTQHLGRRVGYALAVFAYTGVHIVTLNLPLILAALVAGVVWCAIFAREQSLIPGIISHSIWATTIFVFAPVMQV